MEIKTTASGYFIPKNGRYSEEADRIADILLKEDFECRRDYNLQSEFLHVEFSGWEVNKPGLEYALREIAPFVSDGCIEIFSGNGRYTRFYFQGGRFCSFSENYEDGWTNMQPLPPEDTGFIKGLLMDAADSGNKEALRLLSRFED